jgi:hypothetical protein
MDTATVPIGLWTSCHHLAGKNNVSPGTSVQHCHNSDRYMSSEGLYAKYLLFSLPLFSVQYSMLHTFSTPGGANQMCFIPAMQVKVEGVSSK